MFATHIRIYSLSTKLSQNFHIFAQPNVTRNIISPIPKCLNSIQLPIIYHLILTVSFLFCQSHCPKKNLVFMSSSSRDNTMRFSSSDKSANLRSPTPSSSGSCASPLMSHQCC